MAAFKLLILVLDVVNSLDMGPEVAALRELHGAEGACVRLLARMLQQVSLKTLLLSEAMAALLADEGPLPGVDPLMPNHLRGLQESFAAKLASVARDPPVLWLYFRPLFNELET